MNPALLRLRKAPQLEKDPNQFLMVAVRGDLVIGTLQLTLIPGLSRRGTTRAVGSHAGLKLQL